MNRRTRRRLLTVALAAAVGGTVPLWAPPLLSRMDAFRVEDVAVVGARYVAPSTVVELAAVAPGASVWDDPGGWEERIRSHPLIREVQVRRDGRKRLEIRVREVEPVALAATPALVPVAAGGDVLPLDPSAAGLDLPILGGGIEVRNGRLSEGEGRRLLEALVRLREAEPGFVRHASELRLLEDGAVAVHMTDDAGARRILLPGDSLVVGLRRVELALGDHGARTPVAAADARFEGQVVLRTEEDQTVTDGETEGMGS